MDYTLKQSVNYNKINNIINNWLPLQMQNCKRNEPIISTLRFSFSSPPGQFRDNFVTAFSGLLQFANKKNA